MPITSQIGQELTTNFAAKYLHNQAVAAIIGGGVRDLTVERRNFPQFFITAPSPCPYLPERQERKVFTHLVGGNAQDLNSQLSSGGFRRSQNIAYRPACEACHACVSVRVPVEMFEWKRSYRRILDANADVTRRTTKAQASSEHYSLFRDYVDTRHSEGGMADMTVLDFAAMIDQTVVQSKLIEYRVGGGYLRQGKLIAAVLADTLHDGVSLIYSFYAPDMPRRSLGTFMILDAIRYAAEHKLPHVYLGYWVEGSRKMHYKSRFLPQERLTPDGWRLYRRES